MNTLVLALEYLEGCLHSPGGSGRRILDNKRFRWLIAAGSHPFPSRTRKLRLPAPMVLGGRPPGRVGRRRISQIEPPPMAGVRSRSPPGTGRRSWVASALYADAATPPPTSARSACPACPARCSWAFGRAGAHRRQAVDDGTYPGDARPAAYRQQWQRRLGRTHKRRRSGPGRSGPGRCQGCRRGSATRRGCRSRRLRREAPGRGEFRCTARRAWCSPRGRCWGTLRRRCAAQAGGRGRAQLARRRRAAPCRRARSPSRGLVGAPRSAGRQRRAAVPHRESRGWACRWRRAS